MDIEGLRRNDVSCKYSLFINGNRTVYEIEHTSAVGEDNNFIYSPYFVSFRSFRSRGRILILDDGAILVSCLSDSIGTSFNLRVNEL